MSIIWPHYKTEDLNILQRPINKRLNITRPEGWPRKRWIEGIFLFFTFFTELKRLTCPFEHWQEDLCDGSLFIQRQWPFPLGEPPYSPFGLQRISWHEHQTFLILTTSQYPPLLPSSLSTSISFHIYLISLIDFLIPLPCTFTFLI
jgi:hypothetical protein